MSENYDQPIEAFPFLNRLIPITHPCKKSNPQKRQYGSETGNLSPEEWDVEMKRAYNKLSEHSMCLKDHLMEQGEYKSLEEMLSEQTPERRDIFERGESFKNRFKFENLMNVNEINLTEMEVKWLNDFEIDVRYEFLTYVDNCKDITVVDGNRIWENEDMNGFYNRDNNWDTTPIMLHWILMGKTASVYNEYVLWFCKEMIPRGRFEGDFDTYEYIPSYVYKYGSFELLLALHHLFYNCGRPEVVQLINDNIDVFAIFASAWHNINGLKLIEAKYQSVFYAQKINWSFMLFNAHILSEDTGYDVIRYIAPKLTEPCPMAMLVMNMHNRQWRRLSALREIMIENSKWHITSEMITQRMINIRTGDNVWKRRICDALQYDEMARQEREQEERNNELRPPA